MRTMQGEVKRRSRVLRTLVFAGCICYIAGFWSHLQPRVVASTDTTTFRLGIQTNGAGLLLTWPTNLANSQLNFRPDVVQPPSWSNVNAVATVSGGMYQVSVSPGTQNGFFRLSQKAGPFTNTIGMRMVQLPAGSFTMGYWQLNPLPTSVFTDFVGEHYNGDYDEYPPHAVTLTQSFWMGAYEVSNKEYEQFDPSHNALRGKLGYSTNDNEPVIFVNWYDAKAFCDWLTAREGRPYRLPTEAEWEYACRAGTTTHFYTGDTLPTNYLNNPGNVWYPISGSPSSLLRGQTPPNAWGLYDMHGNVEEWCSDWFGPYVADTQTNPVGRVDGMFKATRGGSHSTYSYYMRCENRMGTLPEDESWLIGFRVVMGNSSSTVPLPLPPVERYQSNVVQTVPPGLTNGPSPTQPYFQGPWRYVNYSNYPNGIYGPVYSSHNHDPGGIVECPNGDLLAVWYTCVFEEGRELSVGTSRLPYGTTNWQPISLLYDTPDRNDSAACLWYDKDNTIYYFCGLSAAANWGPLALITRTSTNNGVDWTRMRIVAPEHNVFHQCVSSCFRTASGAILLSCDATPNSSGGTVLWASRDNGQTWTNLAAGRPAPIFAQGNTGAWIAGIHAPVAQLGDGRLIAFGRSDNINGMMPKSISTDEGTNWTYSASIFPSIGSQQRATLLRLQEGPLFFASFGSNMLITDISGHQRKVSGLFAAVSSDGGVTWPNIRLVSDDGPGRSVETLDGTLFTMSFSSAEPSGYLSSTQGKNGIIHLISSREHYQFNLKWLQTLPPSSAVKP